MPYFVKKKKKSLWSGVHDNISLAKEQSSRKYESSINSPGNVWDVSTSWYYYREHILLLLLFQQGHSSKMRLIHFSTAEFLGSFILTFLLWWKIITNNNNNTCSIWWGLDGSGGYLLNYVSGCITSTEQTLFYLYNPAK